MFVHDRSVFIVRLGVCTLSHAAASGNLQIVRAILQAIVKRGLRLRDCEQPISPLIFAVLFNHVDIVRYLNNKTFDLRKVCDMGGKFIFVFI